MTKNPQHINGKKIHEWLDDVKDPEIPVLSITDMGVIRSIVYENNKATVTITPTYSGCPAMKEIEEEIVKCLEKNGINHHKIITTLTPAWTTNWITENGRKKLEEYGIAPPVEETVDKNALFGEPKAVRCPQCKSENTEMVSQFGSTACKAFYKCNDCYEPFDYFKCI